MIPSNNINMSNIDSLINSVMLPPIGGPYSETDKLQDKLNRARSLIANKLGQSVEGYDGRGTDFSDVWRNADKLSKEQEDKLLADARKSLAKEKARGNQPIQKAKAPTTRIRMSAKESNSKAQKETEISKKAEDLLPAGIKPNPTMRKVATYNGSLIDTKPKSSAHTPSANLQALKPLHDIFQETAEVKSDNIPLLRKPAVKTYQPIPDKSATSKQSVAESGVDDASSVFDYEGNLMLTQPMLSYTEEKYLAEVARDVEDIEIPRFDPNYKLKMKPPSSNDESTDPSELCERLARLRMLADNLLQVKLADNVVDAPDLESEDRETEGDTETPKTAASKILGTSSVISSSTQKQYILKTKKPSSSQQAKTPQEQPPQPSAQQFQPESVEKELDPALFIPEKTPEHLTTGIMKRMEDFRKRIAGLKKNLNEAKRAAYDIDLHYKGEEEYLDAIDEEDYDNNPL